METKVRGGSKHRNGGTLVAGAERTRTIAALGGATGAGGRASGAVITPATQQASRDNGQKGGREPLPPELVKCTCAARGDSRREAHAPSCRRTDAYNKADERAAQAQASQTA